MTDKDNHWWEQHPPIYLQRLPLIDKVLDCVNGQEAVYNAGTKYVPMLSGQSNYNSVTNAKALESVNLNLQNSYNSYRRRGIFYNATARTQDAMTGFITGTEPKIDFINDEDDKIDGSNDSFMLEDLNEYLCKESLNDIVGKMAKKTLTAGYLGMLVDTKPADETGKSDKPYVAFYDARDIVNWQYQDGDANKGFSMVILREHLTIKESNLARKKITQFRLLSTNMSDLIMILDCNKEINDAEPTFDEVYEGYGYLLGEPFNGDDTYYQAVFTLEEDNKKDPYASFSYLVVPKRGDEFFKEIPFYVCSYGNENLDDYETPPLLALANLNLAHYRNSVDYENALHITALPTPYMIGVPKQTEDMFLGTDRFINIPQADAKIGYLEFGGQGLNTIKDAMASKKEEMAIMGARMLEVPKRTAESGEAMKVNRAGENSIIATLCSNIFSSLSDAINFAIYWDNYSFDEDKKVIDIVKGQMLPDQPANPQMLTSLMQLYQGELISYDTFFENLKLMNLVNKNQDPETELDKIAKGLEDKLKKSMLTDPDMDNDDETDADDDEADADADDEAKKDDEN